MPLFLSPAQNHYGVTNVKTESAIRSGGDELDNRIIKSEEKKKQKWKMSDNIFITLC